MDSDSFGPFSRRSYSIRPEHRLRSPSLSPDRVSHLPQSLTLAFEYHGKKWTMNLTYRS
jgi:hypothetical protein